MDGADTTVENTIECLIWSDLEADDNGYVSLNELGRHLRQQGIDISKFALLRIASEGSSPQASVDFEGFQALKDRLILELANYEPLRPEEKQRTNKAEYLDLWRDHSGSQDESGELPISQLTSIVCSECNPKHELIDALTALKNDGSESINFEEFCEILNNLPRSGMIDQHTLLQAFQSEDPDSTGSISRTQLYQLLIETGNDPLTKEEVDDMMEDCGKDDMFHYKEWIKRVTTISSLSEK